MYGRWRRVDPWKAVLEDKSPLGALKGSAAINAIFGDHSLG